MGIFRITIRNTSSRTECLGTRESLASRPRVSQTGRLHRFLTQSPVRSWAALEGEGMSHDQLRILMEHGEEMGCINMSAFTALVHELELDDDELNGLYEQIEGRGIELTDDCG